MTTETATCNKSKEECPCYDSPSPPPMALVHCRICGEITRRSYTRKLNESFGSLCLDTRDIYDIEDELKLQGADDSKIIRVVARYEKNTLGPRLFDCRRTNVSTSRYL